MAEPPIVPTTPTFPEWLSAQQGRGDDVADFAREVARLDDFPDSGGKSIYDGYFETTLTGQHETFERAWAEFQASPEPARSDDSERPEGFR